MKINRDIKQRIAEELKEWDVDHSYSRGSKHYRLTVESGNNSRFVIIPCTHSDRRAVFNLIRDLKKTLKELGAEPMALH
jgi:hypothetical protein